MHRTGVNVAARDDDHQRVVCRGHGGSAGALRRPRRDRSSNGADGKPYETRFELRLPTEWSGRFFYQGGGGNDGTVAPAIGRNTGSFDGPALARGFAVVSTDAGHQGATPEFGLDPVARIDHALRRARADRDDGEGASSRATTAVRRTRATSSAARAAVGRA